MTDKLNCIVIKDEIETFLRLYIISVCHHLRNELDYRAEVDDLRVTIVKNVMIRHYYLELKGLLHFQYNELESA